jgi:hypothetical protein
MQHLEDTLFNNTFPDLEKHNLLISFINTSFDTSNENFESWVGKDRIILPIALTETFRSFSVV